MGELRNKLSAFLQKNFGIFYNSLYDIREWWRIKRQDVFPYRFDKKRYPGLFLQNDYEPFPGIESKVEKVIYCFWTGDNEMSENRKRGYQSLVENSGVEVKLITPKNLPDYILPDYPLHPAYDYLSLVHKSDYLRCYFMHFHGGGYQDIKPNYNNWEKAFDRIENDNACFILGCPEKDGISVGRGQGIIDKDLQYYYKSCIGTCGFICKSNTQFTTEWYNELNKRMDSFHYELVKYPGDIKGRNYGYPITLHGILSQIFAPLCLKYKNRIINNCSVFPTRDNYQ